MKILSSIFLIFICIAQLRAEGNPNFFKTHSRLSSVPVDITVGNKINDSTGQATISNSEIQSSIIANIEFLKNAVITSEAPTVVVVQQDSYLVFQAISVIQQKIEVAIQLTTEGNVLKFQNLPGKQIHIWQPRGVCTSCGFYQGWQKNILDCNCNSSGQSVDNSTGGCDHLMFLTE